jgi:branched-subunit amino acid permease
MIMTRDELLKSMMRDIKQYQEEEGLTNGQVTMDVIAALNPAMFIANFGNDPDEWNRLREEAGKNAK